MMCCNHSSRSPIGNRRCPRPQTLLMELDSIQSQVRGFLTRLIARDAALSSAAMSASAASRFIAWNTISTMLLSVAAASTLLWKSLLLLLSHTRPSLSDSTKSTTAALAGMSTKAPHQL
eukprot:GHUV01041765.1.p1 GENE.GHUV01041765.1~~GHUV01041765.1.p1  ORF type:complete len:119 (+),score=22.38 GHUV01041765.1:211-567(+)